ncbi:hypothetical protein Q3G72_015266 [Acer saccharum]|nr:hypothetical protein Q3G72_015266 [Acer saccharum]
MWLDELRDLAYDLKDLLDEFSTEELERKLMAEQNHYSSSILEDAGRAFMSYTDCPSLTSLSSSGQLPEKLRTLIVTYNSKLESIAERFHNNLSLEYIHISTCENLKSIPEGLHNLTSLRKYKILDCDSIVCFPPGGFPLTDLSVEIVRCKELRSLPSSFHSLTSLQELDIWKCPSISSFPEEGFPTNLTRLLIKDNLRIYKSLARWGLHKFTSLTSLIIGGCPDAESFPQEEIGMILPPSLVHLNIQDFKNLKYLCSQGFRNLTSLERLYILYCPKLTSFPEQGLPSSLLQLYINSCPLLKEECKRDIGKEWSNISHIPYVQIDGKFIYEPNE